MTAGDERFHDWRKHGFTTVRLAANATLETPSSERRDRIAAS
jgi:hypothetical protein